MVRRGKDFVMTHAEHAHHLREASVRLDSVTDPVCGMAVHPATTSHHAVVTGTRYHFCSERCQAKFVADPGHYIGPGPARRPEAAPGTIWTCPMHPEIRQDHPGNCPICGMTLEPVMVTAEAGPSPELTDMTRR